jgi:hypothetical protein
MSSDSPSAPGDPAGRIVNLAPNFIGKEDRRKLESFGGHTIAHGRATRWHWDEDPARSEVFEIYRGGKDETLAACVCRDRENDSFYARDGTGSLIATGTLEHLFTELEAYFSRLHGEEPGRPA